MVESPDIEPAAKLVRQGALVAFATETVYGLGADAGNVDAVARVFELKGRPRFDPLIVHAADAEAARAMAATWPETAARLAEAFWPGPLTLVLPKHAGDHPNAIPDLVTAGLPTVALRVPAHPVAAGLLVAADRPIAAPSANRFGHTSPTTAEHVRADFAAELADGRLAMVLDGGPCEAGVESTVVSLADEPTVLRLGAVTVERLEAVIGRVRVGTGLAGGAQQVAGGSAGAPAAPGMLARHYAPRTPLTLVVSGEVDPKVREWTGRVGVLAFDAGQREMLTDWLGREPAAVEVLSPSGELREAAARLFAAMRRLDEAGVGWILAGPAPQRGLGRAINDRLRRAAVEAEASAATRRASAARPDRA